MKNFYLLIFFAAAFILPGCGNSLPVKVPAEFAANYQTPNGVKIQSVVSIPPEKQTEIFGAVERGIGTQILASSFHNPTWNKVRNLADYRVMFIDPDRTNGDGSPALLYREEIQTAGTVIGIRGDEFSPLTIVLPHQNASGWTHLYYLEQAARNESEHFAEHENDPRIFDFFATQNDIHPHWALEGR